MGTWKGDVRLKERPFVYLKNKDNVTKLPNCLKPAFGNYTVLHKIDIHIFQDLIELGFVKLMEIGGCQLVKKTILF